jgi:hypothetical protein
MEMAKDAAPRLARPIERLKRLPARLFYVGQPDEWPGTDMISMHWRGWGTGLTSQGRSPAGYRKNRNRKREFQGDPAPANWSRDGEAPGPS